MSHETKTNRNVRVLVIDDETIVHASVRKILSRLGHEVEGVLLAKEGIERLERETFQLVITDLMMPEMDGIEFLRTIEGMGLRIPVIMVTGYPTIRTAVQALRLGASDYIAKPFTRKELLSPVKRALRQEEKDCCAIAVSHEEFQSFEPGSVVFLPNHAWALFEQDGTFSLGVEESFLQSMGEVASISGSEEMEVIEQGYVGIKLKNTEGEVHAVVMPLSGQIVAVNHGAFDEPSKLTSSHWLLRIIPSQLDLELSLLARRS